MNHPKERGVFYQYVHLFVPGYIHLILVSLEKIQDRNKNEHIKYEENIALKIFVYQRKSQEIRILKSEWYSKSLETVT